MRFALVLLTAALAASIAAGLLGLWPDLRNSSTSDRRARARIAAAVDDFLGSGDLNVTQVRLDYLPHRALIEVQEVSSGHYNCALVAEDFGAVVGKDDLSNAPCDF